jgi:hypothetical protein
MQKPISQLLATGLMLLLIRFSFGQENANPLPRRLLTGKVTSEKGEALAGVMVEWESGEAQYTDRDGRYSVNYEDSPVVQVCYLDGSWWDSAADLLWVVH